MLKLSVPSSDSKDPEGKNIGQRKISDYIAFFNFGIAIIFFVFNCGFLFYQEDKIFK